MNNVKAIFIKQFTSLLKSPSMIIQGILFLLMAAAFSFFVDDEGSDCDACIPAYVCAVCLEDAFELPFPSVVGLFTTMFIGLGLVGSASALVNEDKSTTNLRFMAMADVRPFQYLLGTVASTIIVVAVMLIPYALLGGYMSDILLFMSLGLFGGFVSVMLGIVIGLSKVPFLAMPISLLLGLGPTFSNLNESIANVLRFTFIQQINIAMAGLDGDLSSNFLIIGVNGLVVLLVFALMHHRNRF